MSLQAIVTVEHISYTTGTRGIIITYTANLCLCDHILFLLIRSHILHHMLTNSLFSSSQHGFIVGRSCTTQLLTAMNYCGYRIFFLVESNELCLMVTILIGLQFLVEYPKVQFLVHCFFFVIC